MEPNTGKNLIFSFIRTMVPYIVTSALTFVARKTGFILDEDTKTNVMVFAYGIAFGVYYLAVRLVETYVTPHISFLLGDFRKGRTEPIYAEPTTPVIIPPAEGPQP